VNIFGRIADGLFGSKKKLTVLSLGEGEVATGSVYGLSDGGSWVGGIYSREIPVRLIRVDLIADGRNHQINSLGALGNIYTGESFEGLSEYDLRRLKQKLGQSVMIRAKEPYDSGTLINLARR